MLKIHSFLQRVKKPLEKAMPNHIGRGKTSLAIIAYAMITVLLILNPDYINGKGTEEKTSLAKAEQIKAANSVAGETANEAVVRNDQSNQKGQILQNELNTYITPVTSLMSLQFNLVTNDTKNTNQIIFASNDSKVDVVKRKAGYILNASEMLNSSTVETKAKEAKVKETKTEAADTNQANVSADKKVDSGSTKDKEKESTLSVSSTDKITEDTKEKNSKSDNKSKSETVKKEKQTDKKKSNVIDLSDKEIEVLQRIVEAEASGETTKGKMLVANVILNRVRNNYFPDTVEGVVFQKSGGTYQFSPIKDGRYYSIKVSSDTKKAVNRVLKGEDESKGALYFSARSRADKNSMSWFDNHLTYLFKYGGHEFFK